VAGHYVAVKPDLPEVMSSGGIVLATEYDGNERDRAIAAAITGTIVSVGPQAWKAFAPDHSGKPWAKVGDKVYYIKHVSKIIEDPDDLDVYGKPSKIFILADENITWVIEDSEDE
jgi:co-chaperonin GroES (HSP10)